VTEYNDQIDAGPNPHYARQVGECGLNG
jgi:hypothetical protein